MEMNHKNKEYDGGSDDKGIHDRWHILFVFLQVSSDIDLYARSEIHIVEFSLYALDHLH